MRGTDGTAGGAGGFNIVYNGADNPGGIASGSVAAPATPLGAQFPTSGIVLVKFPKTKLMPSEGTRGQASGSVATALGTEVEYASTGGGFATTSHETFATLGSALAKMVAWAGNRAELWIGGGLAASYVGSKTLTTIRVAGDDGTGPATQTVTFTQNAPAEKDPPSTLKNRVTLFRETSEIATTKTETSDTTTLLLGPMLAIGGRAALLEGLTVSWSLGYSPVMGGKQTSWTRTDTTGSIKTVMTTEVKTLEATDSASPISTSTTTSTSEEVVDTRNKLDKGAVATSISSAFGMATEAVLGFQYRLGPLTIGVEGRDQVVFGINTLTANGSLGLAS
ncbi:MAG: hypothetical protein FJZ01_11265 [Candidatus Sericytochromatia bacterium]|nr:hypothetical protein [Candidatus Tanganyikabacteria bacterium]